MIYLLYTMDISTIDIDLIRPYIKCISLPLSHSHKGENGKLLIIGGSSLFHAASLWSASIASRIVDMVHYASTKENEKIFLKLKTSFVDGMVIKRKDLAQYVKEDDCILMGPGMVRSEKKPLPSSSPPINTLNDVFLLKDEPLYTYHLTHLLIKNFPDKKFVFDAGALQMMDPSWLLTLETKPILTPHIQEFHQLFGTDVTKLPLPQKQDVVVRTARQHNCIILLKAIEDIISDGKELITIHGGNAGLTKGGTGDVLAGLTASFNTKSDQLAASVISSFALKKAGEKLNKTVGLFYNTTDVIHILPKILNELFMVY